ncbi:MAG: YfhO family protein, partial [Bacteroidia bacterium]|nr:YfhO family protein [Bacteroidia bacterium]
LKKIMLISLIVVGGFCLLGLIMPTAVNTFIAPGEEAELTAQFKQSGATDAQVAQLLPGYLANLETARIAIFKSDALRSLLFITIAAAGLFLLVIKKIKTPLFIALIGICFAADLWPVASRYLNSSKFISKAQQESAFAKTEADEEILRDPALDYRVLNLSVSPFQDATTSYHHKSIGGYHGAKLKKYDELISFHLFREIGTFSDGLRAVDSDSAMASLTAKLPVLNMLNTRYLIYPGKDRLIPIKNPEANGNAWFVKQVKTVANADSEIVSLEHTNTKTQALIQPKNLEGINPAESYTAEGSIRMASYQPNHLVYESDTKEKAFAVFSEIYYPKGWNAYVDGNQAPYTCVDYLLRGMEVPAGKHTIEFKFEPAVYKTGNTISLIGSLLAIVLVAAGFYLAWKKKEIAL